MTISAFILAAGKGTRLYPFSYKTPKPMLPLLNMPIIHYSIEHLITAGISNLVIIIQENDNIIPRYIQMTFPDLNPQFIVQEKALGTAHAVLQVKDHINTENFLVIAGDSIFSSSFLKRLHKTHLKERNVITLALERMNFDLMKYSSTVAYHQGRVFEIREKPQTPAEVLSDLNSAALYIFSKSTLDEFNKIKKTSRNEYELATVINETIRQGYRVGGLVTKRVCHISTSYDLWRFNMEFLQKTHNKKVNGNIIGKNVSIDKSALIENSILGNNSIVQKEMELSKCVVFPNTIINQNYEDSVIKSGFFECFTDRKKSNMND